MYKLRRCVEVCDDDALNFSQNLINERQNEVSKLTLAGIISSINLIGCANTKNVIDESQLVKKS